MCTNGKIKRFTIDPWWQWHCRRHGGLALGARLGFPSNVIDRDDKWTVMMVSLSLLVATLHVDVKWRNS